MAAHKRYLDKDIILSSLKNNTLDKLLDAEMLVFDKWGSKFYHELNRKEVAIRDRLEEKYIMYSYAKYLEDPEYSKLKSMSEALISLMTKNRDVDISVAGTKLGVKFETHEQGRYDLMKEKVVQAIIKYFDE